jgi:hypothetical protein
MTIRWRPATVAEIEGVTLPAHFARRSDALAALWGSVKILLLDHPQLRFVGYCLTTRAWPDRREEAACECALDGGG